MLLTTSLPKYIYVTHTKFIEDVCESLATIKEAYRNSMVHPDLDVCITNLKDLFENPSNTVHTFSDCTKKLATACLDVLVDSSSVDDVIEMMRFTLKLKNTSYTTAGDALENFRWYTCVGLTTRLSDKVCRINALRTRVDSEAISNELGESLHDAYKDTIGYCAIAMTLSNYLGEALC